MINSEKTTVTVLSVSTVASYIQTLLSENFSKVWIEAEISNLRIQSNKNIYFSLKDAESSINAIVMPFSKAHQKSLTLEEGQKVQVFCNISYYKKNGLITAFIDEINIEDKKGDLETLLVASIEKFKNLGYLDESKKKKLPLFPLSIGVVSSPTAAGFKDILKVLKYRYPIAKVILFPSSVQGNKAPQELTTAINFAGKRYKDIDVLLIARGGGSREDLWCFNDEKVALAIKNSKVPTITGIGHEIDNTLSDLVADTRAATPSAAAEILSTDLDMLKLQIESYQNKLKIAITEKIEEKKNKFKNLSLSSSLTLFKQKIQNKKENIKVLDEKCFFVLKNKFKLLELHIQNIKKQLLFSSPSKPFEKGFALLKDEKDTHLTSIHQITKNMSIKAQLKDGKFISIVTHKEV